MNNIVMRGIAGLKNAARLLGFGSFRGSVNHGFQKLPFDRSDHLARRAYRHFNKGMPDNQDNFHPELIRRAVDFGYLSWPRKILPEVKGRDILDVGCGTGLHAVGYPVVGVRSYTGIDPKIDFDSDKSKNIRARSREPVCLLQKNVMALLPR